MIDWDSYVTYGKIEGTFKDDSISSQEALFNTASQYLQLVSRPVIKWTLTAVDLYDIDPQRNWNEELYLGAHVTVVDDIMGIEEQCIVSKLTKSNLNEPQSITLELQNVKVDAQKMIANLKQRQLAYPKYLSGDTVAAPHSMTSFADQNNPTELYFEIREGTTLVPSVHLSVNPLPYQQPGATLTTSTIVPVDFSIKVDNTQLQ
jgi:hypothetical protein